MTFEDVKRIRQNPTAEDCDNKELARLIDIALEKQIPQKPIEDGYYDEPAVCPNCGESIVKLLDDNYRIQYCICCGQAINVFDHPTEKGGAK